MAELIISKIKRSKKSGSEKEYISNNEFIPLGFEYVKIEIGNCINSFDLRSFHFKAGSDVQLNYSIKVQNFDENSKIFIYWNNQPQIIEPNKSKILLEAGNTSFKFYYELKIQPTKPIEKQHIHSFLGNNNVKTELPEVKF